MVLGDRTASICCDFCLMNFHFLEPEALATMNSLCLSVLTDLSTLTSLAEMLESDPVLLPWVLLLLIRAVVVCEPSTPELMRLPTCKEVVFK